MTYPPGGTPNYPYPAYPQPSEPPTKQKNTLGLIAVIVSAIGFVFACVPGALIVGWVLLPIAFILSIVGLCQSGKAKGTSVAALIISVIGTVVGVVVFFVMAGNAFSDAFGGSDLSASNATSSAPQNGGDSGGDASGQGSRQNPYPIGQTVSNRDWEITLGAPREGSNEIASENQFNAPPEAGMEFWIVPVTATYTGDDTGNTTFGVSVKFVGSDNRTYSGSCGVVPNSLGDVGELYAGGVAEGNACVAVPAGADGLWSVTTGVVGDPIFYDAG